MADSAYECDPRHTQEMHDHAQLSSVDAYYAQEAMANTLTFDLVNTPVT